MEKQAPRRWPTLLRPSNWKGRWTHVAALAIVVLISAAAALPFLTNGVPQAFDTPIHLARLGALDFALHQGELYPRWLPNLLLGHGYPLFNYYAPASYYVAAALLQMGANAHNAYALSYAIFVLVAGIGMYFWAHDLFGRKSAAILAAAAYLFSPYLLLNVYVRGSFAEACAQAVLPWVFWSFRRLMLADRPARYVPIAALTLGVLAVSHTITLLFAPLALMVYLLALGFTVGIRRAQIWGVASALLLAMGISAFYWLPLIVERGLVSEAAYDIARYGWLPGNVWQWDNFLHRSVPYIYNDNDAPGPVQLSLVQVALAVVGFGLALTLWRRTPQASTRHAELWLLLGILLVAGAWVGAWALPIWQSNRIFAIVQFPWRLLVIMSLPLALAVGGFTVAIPHWLLRAGVTLTVLALVIWAHYPRLDLISFFDSASLAITPDHVAQIEQYKGAEEKGENTSSVQEFKPRWVSPELVWDNSDDIPGDPNPTLNVQVLTDNGWRKEIVVETTQPASLRFNDFYFPGWELQGNPTVAALYPSTNLGLLTVDLTAGSYHLTLDWRGTLVQRVAVWITLLALVALVVWCWVYALRRGWLGVSVILLAMAFAAAFYQPQSQRVQEPKQPLTAAGIELVGLRYEQHVPDYLELYPFWFVRAALPERLEVRWQLLDPQGNILTEWMGEPFYNSYSADNFPTGTLVDDAYHLALPPGLIAGDYVLAGQVVMESSALQSLVEVADVTLRQSTAPRYTPTYPLAVHFEDGITLDGYEVQRAGLLEKQMAADELLVVESGNNVKFRLWWRADPPPHENYHGFIHLVDSVGGSIEQVDQIPGPLFQPPVLWNGERPAPDLYEMHIPASAPSGLYTPWVGIYRFPSENRLIILEDGSKTGPEMGPERDHFELAPIKVVNPQAATTPTYKADVAIGDFAKWIGYDLQAPSPLLPGQSVTLTLYYEGVATTDMNYTRFVHVPHPTTGLVTQSDAVPQGGANPTWTWQRGEVIVDPVVITFPPDAPAGEYPLLLGFYAPEAGGVRAPLQSDEVGRVLGGDVAEIKRVTVGD